MEIYNNLDTLSSLLGVQGAGKPGEGRSRGTVGTDAAGADQATLSQAASEVAQSTGADGVRGAKVASIQAALASGTYAVPASAVASRLVDSMMAWGQ